MEIGKFKSLVERMDKPMSGFAAMKNEEKLMMEAVDRMVGRDDILDVLDAQNDEGGGTFTTFLYCCPQAIHLTKRKGSWRNDDVKAELEKYRNDYGDQSWFQRLDNFTNDETAKKNEIYGIVTIVKYRVNWTTRKSYQKAYDAYKTKLTDLRLQAGVHQAQGDNHNTREKIGGGYVANQTGNIAIDLNMANSKVLSSLCLITDENGHIVGEIPQSLMRSMMTPKTKSQPRASEDLMQRVENGEISQEEAEAIHRTYLEGKAEIDKEFQGGNFKLDNVLGIKASLDGVSYCYINTEAAVTASKRKDASVVIPSELIDYAQEELKETLE